MAGSVTIQIPLRYHQLISNCGFNSVMEFLKAGRETIARNFPDMVPVYYDIVDWYNSARRKALSG